ncbi:MAG: hypothetical protein AAFR02_00570 [Pseudomonadota bacterium]
MCKMGNFFWGGTAVFPVQTEIGFVGEAGPEAIIPMKRGADGSLPTVHIENKDGMMIIIAEICKVDQ